MRGEPATRLRGEHSLGEIGDGFRVGGKCFRQCRGARGAHALNQFEPLQTVQAQIALEVRFGLRSLRCFREAQFAQNAAGKLKRFLECSGAVKWGAGRGHALDRMDARRKVPRLKSRVQPAGRSEITIEILRPAWRASE